jgi:hypothetical protein
MRNRHIERPDHAADIADREERIECCVRILQLAADGKGLPEQLQRFRIVGPVCVFFRTAATSAAWFFSISRSPEGSEAVS